MADYQSSYTGIQIDTAVGNALNLSSNLGEMKTSSIPLSDNKLHLVNGAVLTKTDYPDFVDYIAGLYEDDPTADYFPQPVHETNYTITGSITDNDGVLSGFSTSNYASLPEPFNPAGTWEQQIKFTTSSVSGFQRITGAEHDCHAGVNFVLHDGKMQIWLTDANYTWTINGGDSNENGNFVANTTYWVRVKYDGSKYVVSQSSNGQTFTDIITVNNSTKIHSEEANTVGVGSFNGDPNPFQGSVDMNECYIKEDNKITWRGAINVDTPEQAWQYEVAQTGVCGKFVYDSVNETVRIPKYDNQLYTSSSPVNVYYYITVKE